MAPTKEEGREIGRPNFAQTRFFALASEAPSSLLPSFPPSPPWAAQIGQMNGRGRSPSLSLYRSITLLIFAGSSTLRHSEPSLALSLCWGDAVPRRLLSLMKLFFNSLLPPPLSLCPSVPPSLPLDRRSVVRPLEGSNKGESESKSGLSGCSRCDAGTQ